MAAQLMGFLQDQFDRAVHALSVEPPRLCDPLSGVTFGIAVDADRFAANCTHCQDGASLPHIHDAHLDRLNDEGKAFIRQWL